jgi:DNA-directed RNA polymerase specialized sigma24 family protein
LEPLLRRCEVILKAKVTVDIVATAQELREEILGSFAALFAEDGQPGATNNLDFFECRFYQAFRRFRLPLIKRERARIEPLESPSRDTEDSDGESDDEFFAKFAGTFRGTEHSINYELRQTFLKLIGTLPNKHQKALVLHYYHGLPVESDDSSLTTVATSCGVTGRTVRTWLAAGIASLARHFNSKRRHANELG